MRAFLEFLRRNLWAAFIIHQLAILTIAVGFLTAIRRFSGRNIHLGAEPLGIFDGLALTALSVAVIYLTIFYYYRLKGKDAAPLGIAFSARRWADLIIGLVVGFAFAIAPWWLAIWRNTATVTDRLDAHYDRFSAGRIFIFAFFLLLVQGVMEETANRAFPMRLWERRPLLFRLFVPALFFALIHLANENFSFERFAVLITAGVLQGVAYLLTGNIWLSSGLHTGANVASFSISGLWHAGALVAVTGYSSVPDWLAISVLLLTLSAALFLKETKSATSKHERTRNLPDIIS